MEWNGESSSKLSTMSLQFNKYFISTIILVWTLGVIVVVDANVELWRCGKSFLDLPTIYMKDQQYVDVCILLSDDVMTLDDVKCGTDVAHACLGVRYLKDYNTPLYAGTHFQNTPDVVLGLSRTNNFPKGRPIGMAIAKDDGKTASDTDDTSNKALRSDLPTVVMKNDKETSPMVWSEAAWINGECKTYQFIPTFCLSLNFE